MDISISSSYGQIGIDYIHSKIDVAPNPPTGDIHYSEYGVRINSEDAKANIDMQECWADIGLKRTMRFARDNYQIAGNKTIDNIKKKAAEGNRLMRIENGKASIVPKSNYNIPRINVTLMPKHGPRIYWSDPLLRMDYHEQNVDIDWNTETRAVVNATMHNVDIFLLKEPFLDIKYVGIRVDEVG